MSVACFQLMLLLSLWTLQVLAACRMNEVDWQADEALSQLLSSCERPVEANEARLYTWGHKEKLALLTHDGYALFRIYNDAQQFAFAGMQARRALGEYADYPRFPRYTKLLRSTLGTATVGELYAYSKDGEMRDRLQRLWQRQITRDGNIPAPADDGTKAAADKGLMALAFNQVNPGFLDDLPYPLDELIKTTQEALKSNTPDQHRRLQLQGRLLGLKRAEQAGAGGLPSNISYGPAIYFSNTPHSAIHHYYDEDHTGITCSLLDTDRITDLSDPEDRRAMLSHDIFLHDAAGQARKYPGGYNELANPVTYRQASQNRIIKNGAVYADTGVFHYKTPGICRQIRLGDFADCEAVTKLLSVGLFYGGRAPGPLYSLLTFDQPEQQLQGFLGLVRACAVSPAAAAARQSQRLPALPNSCNALKDERFRQGNFYRQNSTYLDALQKEKCR